MPAWLVWLIISGVLAIAEMFSMAFVLIMLAGGAAAGAIAAALGAPGVVQGVVAAATATGLLVGVRPVVRRHALHGPVTPTGIGALIGMEAVVLTRTDSRDGRVRLNGGEWSARTLQKGQELPAGTVVRVVEIDGATAVVWQEPT